VDILRIPLQSQKLIVDHLEHFLLGKICVVAAFIFAVNQREAKVKVRFGCHGEAANLSLHDFLLENGGLANKASSDGFTFACYLQLGEDTTEGAEQGTLALYADWLRFLDCN
jgi:hypothetical protein